MVQGHIRFSTSILSRLGEELNPNVDQGILELVKNAYDADATFCRVRIDQGPAPKVVVEDDGRGMTQEEILSGWLVLGSSNKQTSERTALGRIPAGNKGLGRLAALRLGRLTHLVTRSVSTDQELRVTLDWDAFDAVDVVDDLAVEVTQVQREAVDQGTEIHIHNLRRPIGRMEVKRLARAMILLADPFGEDESGFRPVLDAPDYEDLAELVARRYFADAEFHLKASLRGGKVTGRVTDWRGDTLYEGTHEDIGGDYLYTSPDADFELWVFSLTASSFTTRSTSLGEVRDWLSAFGGVHIYTNGLRVAPYGNPGNDWLDMNLARVRNPEERPSTNTAIGRVRIDDPDGSLVQKTDRSGFIESPLVDDIRRFAHDSLEWMARRRLRAAEKRRAASRENAKQGALQSRKSVEVQIKKISDPKDQAAVSRAFSSYDQARERESSVLRKEVQLYRTLSTAGIVAATFAHESNGNPLKLIDLSVNALEFKLRKDLGTAYDSTVKDPIQSIKKASSSLNVLAAATLRLVDQDKRRPSRVNLHDVIDEVLETYKPFLESRSVAAQKEFVQGRPYLQATEAAVESIVTNLINNSLAAFDGVPESLRIVKVRTDIDGETWTLTVLDNGPGIVDISIDDVWLPGETRRANGTGLGLTIVRDSVLDLGGSVKAKAIGELGGAEFTVQLPILGA